MSCYTQRLQNTPGTRLPLRSVFPYLWSACSRFKRNLDLLQLKIDTTGSSAEPQCFLWVRSSALWTERRERSRHPRCMLSAAVRRDPWSSRWFYPSQKLWFSFQLTGVLGDMSQPSHVLQTPADRVSAVEELGNLISPQRWSEEEQLSRPLQEQWNLFVLVRLGRKTLCCLSAKVLIQPPPPAAESWPSIQLPKQGCQTRSASYFVVFLSIIECTASVYTSTKRAAQAKAHISIWWRNRKYDTVSIPSIFNEQILLM